MFDDGFIEDFVEFGSFDFLMASGVDFGGEFKKFSDVLAGFAAGDEDGGVREEVKIIFEFVKNGVDGGAIGLCGFVLGARGVFDIVYVILLFLWLFFNEISFS